MRAALLPTPGDPFMLAYWLRNYETWRHAVDELVVLVNGSSDVTLRSMVEAAGGRCILVPWRLGHDGAIAELLDSTAADLIVLCEDDAYVRSPDEVANAFGRIEAGDVDIVGSPRHEDYASSPLQEWPRYLTEDADEMRRGLWPAFLFCRRSDLLDTDRRFGDRRWAVGEMVPGWRKVAEEDCVQVGIAADFIHLDTLFGTTFQLRAKGLRIDLVHHVRLFDAVAAEVWLAEDPPWFHVTGLSTLDEVLSGRSNLPDMDDHGGLWTRRVAWWMRTTLDTDLPGKDQRLLDLAAFSVRAHISAEDLAAWMARLDRWAPQAVAA